MKREGTKIIMEGEEFQDAVSKAYRQGVDHAMNVLSPAVEQVKRSMDSKTECDWVASGISPITATYISSCGLEIDQEKLARIEYKFCPNCGRPIRVWSFDGFMKEMAK